jgi:calmodulin
MAAGQPVKLTSEKMTELREAFMLFDYTKSGRINARDIGPVVRSVGLKPSEAEIHDIMGDVQQMGGDVDLATLVELVSAKVTNPPAERPEALREMFSIYDKDNRGSISEQEMKHLLTSVGEKLTDEEADQLLKASGCVQNGQVQYDKFIQVVLKG